MKDHYLFWLACDSELRLRKGESVTFYLPADIDNLVFEAEYETVLRPADIQELINKHLDALDKPRWLSWGASKR